MKYSAPKAELVSLEITDDILLISLGCIIDFGDNKEPGTGEGGGDDGGIQLPDFYE